MTTSPPITVCIPTYNGAAYLDDCLEGVAAQTMPDFEVLVVDDCSSDATVAIAEGWASRDARIRVVRNPSNLGLVGNWNRCVELARGTWIKFLFQDDLMRVDCLARLYAAGEASDGFVACARTLLYDDSVGPELRDWYDRHAAVLREVHRAGSMSAEQYAAAKIGHLELNLVGEPTVTLIRRDLFERVGPFDPLLVQTCDGEMWNRLALSVGLVYLPDELVTFRIHGGSASARFRENPFRGGTLDEIIEIYRLCHSPALAAFQRVARDSGSSERVLKEMERLVNKAFDMVRTAERDGSDPGEMRKTLRLVLDRLSGYAPALRRYRRHRIQRFLGLA